MALLALGGACEGTGDTRELEAVIDELAAEQARMVERTRLLEQQLEAESQRRAEAEARHAEDLATARARVEELEAEQARIAEERAALAKPGEAAKGDETTRKPEPAEAEPRKPDARAREHARGAKASP